MVKFCGTKIILYQKQSNKQQQAADDEDGEDGEVGEDREDGERFERGWRGGGRAGRSETLYVLMDNSTLFSARSDHKF